MLLPQIIQEKYLETKVEVSIEGKKEIKNLPKRTPGEASEIRGILSAHFCRTCASCCRGFGFSKKDPHYATIRKKIKENKEKFVLVRGENHPGYDVGVPRKQEGCGFLHRGYELSSIPAEVRASAEFMGCGAPMSCGIYQTQPSTCKIYPLIWTWMADSEGDFIKNGGIIGIDSSCCAVEELLRNGIGHLTESELMGFEESGGNWKNKAESFPASLREVYRYLEADKSKKFGLWIMQDGQGERVFPIVSPGIVDVVSY